MAEFSDKEGFRAWLEARPDATRRPEAVALASRAAASVLPLVVSSERQTLSEICLAAFSANMLAWAAARYPKRVAELRTSSGAKASHFASGYGSPVSAAASAAHTACASSRYAPAYATASAEASAFAHRLSTALLGSAMAGSLIAGSLIADFSLEESQDCFARIRKDVEALEVGESSVRLMKAPLWPDSAYALTTVLEKSAREHWLNLTECLLREAGHWKVWITWYDAVLDGLTWLPVLSEKQREDLTIKICLLPEEDWKDPKIANAKIAALIDAALEQARGSTVDAPSISVPDPAPAALQPDWREGRLILAEEPVAASLAQDAFEDALRALREEIVELAEDIRERSRHSNFDTGPIVKLERLADLLGAGALTQADFFRLVLKAKLLSSCVKVAVESWPEIEAAHYGILVAQFTAIALQTPVWRAFVANLQKSAPEPAVVEQAARHVTEFANLLIAVSGRLSDSNLIDPAIPKALKVAADDMLELASGDLVAHQAAAASQYQSINNILQKLAVAWKATQPARDLGVRTGKGFANGFSENLPKHAEDVGDVLAEIVVWAPLTAAAGYLASQYGWFAPVAEIINKKYQGRSKKK